MECDNKERLIVEKEVIIQEVKERDCQSTGQIEIDYHEIIAICDSIDAMTSTRSYRKAHDSTFCYEEINGTDYQEIA